MRDGFRSFFRSQAAFRDADRLQQAQQRGSWLTCSKPPTRPFHQLLFCLVFNLFSFFFLSRCFQARNTEYGVRFESSTSGNPSKCCQRFSITSPSPGIDYLRYYYYRTAKETRRDKLSWIFPSWNRAKRKNHASLRIETAYTGITILSLQINTKSRHRYVCTFVTSRIPRPAL